MEKNMKMKPPEGLNSDFEKSLSWAILVFKEVFNTDSNKKEVCGILEKNLNLPNTLQEV